MHSKSSWLSDVILGGQDGLVNVLGISLGLSAAGANTFIILAAGLAATITESISMGAVAYTSSIAERDRYLSEQARERREIATTLRRSARRSVRSTRRKDSAASCSPMWWT
jgi:VIT1/CCC1 family predicted Fe2+/Mn2+ transporter